MPNRNDYRNVVINDAKLREKIHDRKFVDQVKILTRTPHNDISREEIREEGIFHKQEMYSLTNKMYRLAHKHYGSPDYWWVIAWYNNKPKFIFCWDPILCFSFRRGNKFGFRRVEMSDKKTRLNIFHPQAYLIYAKSNYPGKLKDSARPIKNKHKST